MPVCGAETETNLPFSHPTINASVTTASRAWGSCWPASPKDPIKSEPRDRNRPEECMGWTSARPHVAPSRRLRHESPLSEGACPSHFASSFSLSSFWHVFLAKHFQSQGLGRTSRMKVPLWAWLRSTRRSHARRFPLANICQDGEKKTGWFRGLLLVKMHTSGGDVLAPLRLVTRL